MPSLHFESHSTKFKRARFPFRSTSIITFPNIITALVMLLIRKSIFKKLFRNVSQIFYMIFTLCFTYISNTCLRRSQSLSALKVYLDNLHSIPKTCQSTESTDTKLCSSDNLYIQSNPSFLFSGTKKICIVNTLHEPPTKLHSEKASSTV